MSLDAPTAPSTPRYQGLLTQHRDLNPDTLLRDWEPSLSAYAELAPVRHLAEDVVFVSGWAALREMLQNEAASFDYIISASAKSDHEQAHRWLQNFGKGDDGLTRTERKSRAAHAVSDVVAAQSAALEAWVEACFQRLVDQIEPVDLQLGFAIPLAMGSLAIAHGVPPERQELLHSVFPELAKMRHLFDFVRHDQAIAEADQICTALMEAVEKIGQYYREAPASAGLHEALRQRGDSSAHATMVALHLAGTSTIAEILRWLFWKEQESPDFLPDLRASAGRRDFALNMLRLFVPQPLIYREAQENGIFGGVRVRAGSKIFANSVACLRDPRVMAHPNAFLPENAPFARLVFGGGSRRCPGMAYAVEVTHLAVQARARLPGRFSLEFPGGAPTVGLFKDRSAGAIRLHWQRDAA